MLNDDQLYLGHMLDMATKAVDKVQDVSRIDYDQDENLRLALAHLIQIIGEAANRVSQLTRDQHADIPWHAIIGMRHRIVHGYMALDDDTVWEVATADLPTLAATLRRITGPESQRAADSDHAAACDGS